MDELEFRRKIIAEPYSADKQVEEFANATSANQAFVAQMRQLDNQLKAAMKVEPPEGLADRILLSQSFADNETRLLKRSRLHLAIAASIAFFIGVTVSQFNWQQLLTPTLGDVALAHVYNELPFTQEIDESASLAGVNSKLARYGLEMTQSPEHIYYVNHCDYHGDPALHMIVKGKMGRVTVFIVPKGNQLKPSQQFSDNQMKGETLAAYNTNIVLVGDKNEPLTKMATQLKQQLKPMLI